MYLPEILKQRSPALSIEIFPPKTSKGDEALITHLERLAAFRPAFVSCTYGAGGSTRTRTVELCQMIQQRFSLPATAHFTCVGSTREELVEWLEYAVQAGVKNIMALRGDAPEGQEEFKRVEGGLGYANELVELIRKHQPQMGIGVAGYPEKHNEAPDLATDLDNLKRKVDAGADAIFTQLFFDNQSFFTFQDECRSRGIEIPIVPGIMPITEFARIKRITSMCGAKMPADLAARLEAVQDDAEAQFEIGVEHAIAQCSELLSAGVPGIHFYALNKSEACDRILEALGVVPQR
ncbi:MAG: methylenetetrahydrofolate reductase [NAD(P)H] [Planctomycetaceae bacterium]|nr:methylenetetrahydrofolate reductase [NAD(P)H] [Planctomycetaceae bacterium]MCB9950615.1 methylenetetrahydrofolate reductase [NAD(P)H] [Planctomycetaceae bacterium]